jgi:UPF0271 protein
MTVIDLNCDMGESFGPWKMGQDEEVLPHVTSANVACGAHAGDPSVMAQTVALARKFGVAVGAHPGFPDLQGFGRRRMTLSGLEIYGLVLYQIGALWGFVRAEGLELHHVKPHGALYNMACADAAVARPIVDAVRSFSRELPIYCLPGSELERGAREQGLAAVPEGFADRAYEPNGSLADRSKPGAVAADHAVAAARAVQLAHGSVTCLDGSTLTLHVRTICIHGDTPGAAQNAAAVRRALTESGFTVSAALDA